ncbi:MAG: DUF72 domain-containing protein [Planctomycetota bacterium]
MGTLIYGTSSWSEKSWVGPFYPAGTSPGAFLEHYATQFGAVEADTTYYGIPAAAMVEGWVRKTPPGFELAAKFPRSIVHGGEGARPDPDVVLAPDRVQADTERFLEVMRRLGDRGGPLVLQFPYFNKGVFPHAGPFLERLDAYLAHLPGDFRYAVEVRNRWWIKPPLLEVLRRHRTALVLVELSYLPHPAELAAREDLVTTDFVYARLIGDRKAVEEKTKTFDQVVLDRSSSLQLWANLLRELRERVPKAYVFANNHYAGHGPATIRELVGLVLD